jgi:large subunit ribosomal protein L30
MAKAKSKDNAQLRLTLVKSKYGRRKNHQSCLMGLGLRRINQSVTVPATPENLGMVNTVSYLLKVEEL